MNTTPGVLCRQAAVSAVASSSKVVIGNAPAASSCWCSVSVQPRSAKRGRRSPFPSSHCPLRHFSTSARRSNSIKSRHPSSPYDVLRVPRTASQAEIKLQYYDLVKRLHPDRRRSAAPGVSESEGSSDIKGKGKLKASEAGEDSTADEEFRRVVKAYELLSEPKKRNAFDRYGFGWDPSFSNASPMGFGTFGAADRSEWSEIQRRQAWAGRAHTWWATHDQTGWQNRQQAARDDEFFYSRGQFHGHHDGKPRYAPNSQFIALVAITTWTLAIFQFNRLSNQAAQASALADKKHLDAANSLQEAKGLARSDEGRRRLAEMRARAREGRVLDQIDAHRMRAGDLPSDDHSPIPALPPPPRPSSSSSP